MTKRRPTLRYLINLAMEMEKRAYAFYGGLEKNLADNALFVSCMRDIKEDELMHLRVLQEIRDSLSEVRLESTVPNETIEKLERAHEYLDGLDMDTLTDADDIIDAIRTLEDTEFGVVMSFVDITEINFEFTRDYLQNETVDHASRIFKAQQYLD